MSCQVRHQRRLRVHNLLTELAPQVGLPLPSDLAGKVPKQVRVQVDSLSEAARAVAAAEERGLVLC